ncbi:MAG: alpha-amylase family glycosyl hydrolase [Acidimicrobiales bacterium]
MTVAPWWRSTTIYQIYPRSFASSSSRGVGDLRGIAEHLDHVRDLGAGAIWLSPFFTSPMADFGYDVADYCDVDPTFGTLEDFDDLVERAHERELKVVIDWVPNHSSNQHPWFIESNSSRSNPRADWYVWRDGDPAVPPNNWKAAFSDDPAWTWSESRKQWYLHLFLAEQPDLNWHNPDVEAAMLDTLRFWLDRGVDGFRMDVIHMIGKGPELPDFGLADDGRLIALHDWPATHEFLRRIRSLLDSYPSDRMSVGEVYILSTRRVATYYGEGDELHLSFNFPPLHAPWDASVWRQRIERVEEEFTPRDAWPTWVLSNHDQPRHRTRYGSEARARAAAVLLLTLRGTPFLYQGEELGLEDAVVPADRVVDPGGRDGCRAPIPWTGASDHGWGTDDAWLPWPPDAIGRSVESESDDPSSMLYLYRRILAARAASPALQLGRWEPLASPPDVLAYRRVHEDDERVVIVNFGDEARSLALGDAWMVEVASDTPDAFEDYPGAVGADQALILRR